MAKSSNVLVYDTREPLPLVIMHWYKLIKIIKKKIKKKNLYIYFIVPSGKKKSSGVQFDDKVL